MGRGEDQLIEAIKSQDVSLVHKLLSKGKGKLLGSAKKINVNQQNGEGLSALHQAALGGNVDISFLLIDSNAIVDVRDKNGFRPLHYSAMKGKIEVVAALLESGASCNGPANNGCTPLHLASQYGHYKACKILLQYGADISARQSDGSSALDLACEFCRTEVVQYFLQYCDAPLFPEQIQSQRPGGGDFSMLCSPLHLAARNGHIGIIRLLIQGGADINWRTSAGTCLHEAITSQKPEIVQLLIDCGINVTLRSGLGQTGLELAHKLPKSANVAEIIRKLTEAQPRFLQAYAINDFQNILDRNSLAFTKGTLITVLEQNANGNWKGRIEGSHGEPPMIGTFPSSFVELVRQPVGDFNMAGSNDSGFHPHEEEFPPPYCSVYGHRPSASTFHHSLSHQYTNLDPKTKLNQNKPLLTNPNVVNPSYEDVIYSQKSYRPIKSNHQFLHQPITTSPLVQNTSISRNRPSITNPGYEDVLVAPPIDGISSNTLTTSGRINEQHIQKLKSVLDKREELSIEKLGHQKKILLEVSDLNQFKSSAQLPASMHQISAHGRPGSMYPPPPPTRPKPGSMYTSPPPTRPKPGHMHPPPPAAHLKPISSAKNGRGNLGAPSFMDNAGVSNELAKALNKRQKIIDEADKAPSSPTAGIITPPLIVEKPKKIPIESAPQLNPTYKNPEEESQRISNLKRPKPPPPKRISSVNADGGPDTTSYCAVSPPLPAYCRDRAAEDGSKHPALPSNTATSNNSGIVRKVPPPPVSEKPKKFVTAKPKPAKIADNKFPQAIMPHPTAPTKPTRFDLSALDDAGQKAGAPVLPGKWNDAHIVSESLPPPPVIESGDEFEWPAPPTSSSEDHIFSTVDFPPPPPLFDHSKPSKPSAGFKDSISHHQKVEINPEAIFSSHSDDLPPPLGQHEPPFNYERGVPSILTVNAATSSDDFHTIGDVQTRQMLDDITNMFDDLVQEFDDIMT